MKGLVSVWDEDLGHNWSHYDDVTQVLPHPPHDTADNIGHWIPVWHLKETGDIDGTDWSKLDYKEDQDLN